MLDLVLWRGSLLSLAIGSVVSPVTRIHLACRLTCATSSGCLLSIQRGLIDIFGIAIFLDVKIIDVNRIKKSYPSYYSFESEDILSLCKEFKSRGFDKQTWKLPINNNFHVSKGPLTTEDYFALNYNFPAVIAVFENPENQDTVKIMFVNISGSMKKFDDFTFPSSESEGPKYYIESADEIRAVGYKDYVKQILKRFNRNKGLQYRFASTFNLLSFLYIIGYFAGLQIVNENIPKLLPFLSALLVLAILTVFLYTISIKRGVYINSFPNPLLSFIDQMIKGSFLENPITYVFFRVFAVIVTGIIGGLAFNLVQVIFGI